MSNVILNPTQLGSLRLTKSEIEDYSAKLKLPRSIILRLHELALYSFLDGNESVTSAFRIMVKKRYYANCIN